MSAEDEFAKEIAKQLPVKAAYKDAIRPASRQTGEMAEQTGGYNFFVIKIHRIWFDIYASLRDTACRD